MPMMFARPVENFYIYVKPSSDSSITILNHTFWPVSIPTYLVILFITNGLSMLYPLVSTGHMNTLSDSMSYEI